MQFFLKLIQMWILEKNNLQIRSILKAYTNIDRSSYIKILINFV